MYNLHMNICRFSATVSLTNDTRSTHQRRVEWRAFSNKRCCYFVSGVTEPADVQRGLEDSVIQYP